MKKIFLLGIILFLFGGIFVSAENEDFSLGKELVLSKVSCDALTEEQLEDVGDYYMEQMHPGRWHEYMDLMMGGEGSESLRQAHLAIARSFYCGDASAMTPEMMNIITGNNRGFGMMGYPVLADDQNYTGGVRTMMGYGYGMMGSWGYGYWRFMNILYVLLLVGAVILVYFWIWRLLKNTRKKK